METIKSYLDNIFRNLPKTKEMERLKNEIYYNMEERYHELKNSGKPENEAIGIVISEFGNIDELLEEMDISPSMNNGNYPVIEVEEAMEFISLKEKASYMIAAGTGLILLGVSILVFLTLMAERNLIFQTLPQDAKDTLPVVALLVLIVPAVALFIYSGTKLERFKFIEEGKFEISSDLKSILDAELPAATQKQNMFTIIGVSLCILSVVVVIAFTLFEPFVEFGVCVMLLMIAVAVFIFIVSSSVPSSYKKLMKIDSNK
ncbi:MAG TPA: permease prefix domain 1-containing protein [Acetivibrio sp.]|uniref:permease prefix domain 1-containing protein n=1 Tax=Acetivibrio sp. TaxID=1872092 RepID=UPI002BA08D93|nr:permease prefix domain 1-containing protein [Acetivibrio sp.]HOM02224.1 permease prefix domain 1-containing protein [Acetivibrio sp.]